MACLFSVELNGKSLDIPEGDDLASLEIGFFCTAHWNQGNLNIGGLRSHEGVPVQIGGGPNVMVPRGSTLRTRHLGGHIPATPLDKARLKSPSTVCSKRP